MRPGGSFERYPWSSRALVSKVRVELHLAGLRVESDQKHKMLHIAAACHDDTVSTAVGGHPVRTIVLTELQLLHESRR